MKRVYVCGPLTLGGSETNREALLERIETAELVGAAIMRLGYEPVMTHQLARHQAALDAIPNEAALEVCFGLVRGCHAIALIHGWLLSEGSRKERELAKNLGLFGFSSPGGGDWTREAALEVLGAGRILLEGESCPAE